MRLSDDDMNYHMIPVINNKDDDLCNGDEEVCKVSNGVILVVHPWEIHHIKTLNMLIQVVHEGNSCPLYLRGPSGDLYNNYGAWK